MIRTQPHAHFELSSLEGAALQNHLLIHGQAGAQLVRHFISSHFHERVIVHRARHCPPVAVCGRLGLYAAVLSRFWPYVAVCSCLWPLVAVNSIFFILY